MSKCRHFSIKELVSPAVFKRYGEDAWAMIDDRLCVTLDAMSDAWIILDDPGLDAYWPHPATPKLATILKRCQNLRA